MRNKNIRLKLLKRTGKKKIFSKKSFFDALAVLLVLQLILPSFFFFLLAGPEARAALLMTHTTTSDFSSGVAAQTVVASNNVTLATQEFGDGSDGAVTINSNIDINANDTNADSDDNGSCADGINYAVSSFPANNQATLASDPTGCIVVGDEVLLINLKGTSGANTTVGNYEFLIVSGVGTTLTFNTDRQKTYDSPATQKIMIQRVPNYTNVNVNWGYTLTCSAWNGVKGGVLAFRASGTVMVGNTTTGSSSEENRYAYINASEKGYRGGSGGQSGVNSKAGETHFGGLYDSGGNVGGQNGLTTPNPGGGGGGGGAYPSVVYTGSVGTVGTAGGGGGAGMGYNHYCGGSSGDGYSGGGGGGGYGSVGTNGSGAYGAQVPVGATGGTGGNTSSSCYYGSDGGGGGGGGTTGSSAQLNTKAYLGAGGGGSGAQGVADDPGQNGKNGGAGGGIVFIGANTLNVSYDVYTYTYQACCDGYGCYYSPDMCQYTYTGGTDYGNILNNGQNGDASTPNTYVGGGGGGTGGSVVILANTFNNEWSGGVTANGALGGNVFYFDGGAGGGGRIYAAYNSFSGSAPTPNYAPSTPLTIHYNPSGTFTGVMNAQRTGVSWDALSWQTTQLTNTAIAFKARSYGATQSNPDFSSCTTLGTANSGSPNGSASLIGNSCVGNQQYLYYQGSFSTPSPYSTTPSLDQIDVGYGFPDVKIGGFVKYLGNIIFK